MSSSTSTPPYSLAILDDYASIASPYFALIPSTTLTIITMPYPLSSTELKSRLEPFAILSTMRERTPLPASVLAHLPNLKLILTTGSRNASFDIPACTERGIAVAGTMGMKKKAKKNVEAINDRKEQEENVKGEGEGVVSKPPNFHDSTTQHTWALILGLAGNVPRGNQDVRSGGWQSNSMMNTGLAGKTLGILGLGRLGARTARIGIIAFGMKVTCWSTNLTQGKADEVASQVDLEKGSFRVVTKEDLFRTADVLSVHYVLSERSVGIVGGPELETMKPSAMFVNTSRGKLVNEGALLKVLKDGRIKAAALDVFYTEPLEPDSEWRTTRWGEEGRSEVLMSPHMGYVEEDMMHRWYEEQAENVERWIEGKELMTRLN